MDDGVSVATTRRNNTFDAMVEPCFRRYPINAEGCANITRSDWSPTTEVVKRWLELCKPERWAHIGVLRLICLEPLNIQQLEMTLDMMMFYVSTVGQNLQTISDELQAWQQRDRVGTIVIPVHIGST